MEDKSIMDENNLKENITENDADNNKKGKKGKLIAQILKFGVVGGLSFLIDFVVYTLVIKTIPGTYSYIAAGIAGFTISLIFNYLASMAFVFERKDNANKKVEFLIFLVLSLIGLLLNTALLWLYVDILCGKVNWIISLHEIIYNWLVGIGFTFFKSAPEFMKIMAKIFATAIVMVYNFISRKMTLEKKD